MSGHQIGPSCTLLITIQTNILVDDDEHVKIADLGLVLIGDATAEHMTTTRDNAGTVRYMSPQRLQSEHRRTTSDDVYAFACISYTVCKFSSLNQLLFITISLSSAVSRGRTIPRCQHIYCCVQYLTGSTTFMPRGRRATLCTQSPPWILVTY
jgi:serine/threonine protein kinase